jgi:hypothetical protein
LRHVADNCLATFVDRDALDIDALLALAAVALQSLDLRREGAGEAVQRFFVALSVSRDVVAPRRDAILTVAK